MSEPTDKERLELARKGICPSCHKGKLSPSGRRWWVKQVFGRGKTRPQQEMTEFICNNCHMKHVQLGLHEYLGLSDDVKDV